MLQQRQLFTRLQVIQALTRLTNHQVKDSLLALVNWLLQGNTMIILTFGAAIPQTPVQEALTAGRAWNGRKQAWQSQQNAV